MAYNVPKCRQDIQITVRLETPPLLCGDRNKVRGGALRLVDWTCGNIARTGRMGNTAVDCLDVWKHCTHWQRGLDEWKHCTHWDGGLDE